MINNDNGGFFYQYSMETKEAAFTMTGIVHNLNTMVTVNVYRGPHGEMGCVFAWRESDWCNIVTHNMTRDECRNMMNNAADIEFTGDTRRGFENTMNHICKKFS